MLARVMTGLALLHQKLGTAPLALLVLGLLYGLYVVKMHLGIDLFPNWGLHLLGPRSLLRAALRLLGG